VGTDVHDLSTLAGARSGTVGTALRARRQGIELQPLETRTSGGATAYLKVENPRFLFPRARRALWWRPPSSLQRSRMLSRRAPAPPWHAPSLLQTARRRALPRPPRALALPPLRLSVRGRRIPPLRWGPAPVTFFFFSLSRRRVLRGHRGRKSLLLAQPVLLVPLFPALPPPDPPLLLGCRPLLHPPLCRARGRSGSGHGRSDRAASTVTLC
jgi:hypothetical protein